ncbi:MAG: sulfotransferase [Bacteroidetes bacterium]|nr:sulfotransferase [Bacteroidota bacterium]
MYDVVLDPSAIGQLKYFCMFIGYPYSGHSLVGAIIDAHPNAVISHELHVGRLLKKGLSKEKIFPMIIMNSIRFAQQGRTWNNYSYLIPGEWNGRYTSIRVIGDKKGGRSTRFFTKKSEVFECVDSSFGVPVRYVHVMRNPYDLISTLYLRRTVNAPDKLKLLIDRCFQHIEHVEDLRKHIEPDSWLDIYHEHFLGDPDESIETLFRFIGLEVPAGFIDHCKQIMFKTPHKSRLDIPWKEEEINYVAGKLAEFRRFSAYTFNS